MPQQPLCPNLVCDLIHLMVGSTGQQQPHETAVPVHTRTQGRGADGISERDSLRTKVRDLELAFTQARTALDTYRTQVGLRSAVQFSP